jgi:Bacterial regulatory helix-turn-helix protein, lysR family
MLRGQDFEIDDQQQINTIFSIFLNALYILRWGLSRICLATFCPEEGALEFGQLREGFIAVAEELNFTRAAARIGIGQPPLSQQIRTLEEELGEPLFRRLSHGAELTAAGRAFLPEARKMIALAQRAKRTAQRGARGEVGQLKLGFTSSASYCRIVAAALRAFRSNPWQGWL